MRRSIQGAVALLSVLVVAGCSAPAPEPTPSATAPSPSATSAPEPVADTVEWTLPADCEGLAWPAIRYAQEEFGDVVQPWDTGNLPGWVGEADEMVSCLSGPPASDATTVWSASRIAVAESGDRLDEAIVDGYAIIADELVDGSVRSVRLHRPPVDDSLGHDYVAVIGDAWLHVGNTSEHGGEALLGMAGQLDLPRWSDWVLPAGCGDQLSNWPEFAEFVNANGWDASAMPQQTDSTGSLFARLGYPGLSVSCLWGYPSSDWLHYLSVTRLDEAERGTTLDALEENGYTIADEAAGRTLLLMDHGPESISGYGTNAAIMTGDALVLAEALDGFTPEQATSFVEAFARGVGLSR